MADSTYIAAGNLILAPLSSKSALRAYEVYKNCVPGHPFSMNLYILKV
jgi:hypothetical protein